MNEFWQLAGSGAPAVIEAASGRIVSYAQLAADADASVARLDLAPGRGLVSIFIRNDYASLAAYLGCLRAGHAVTLLPAGNQVSAALLEAYVPDRVFAPAGAGPFAGYSVTPVEPGALDVWRAAQPHSATDLHPDLALLLSTSGTTGSPKLVRLSRANLQANASDIRTYLEITTADRAPTLLPLSYSYGLSVVHSHLAAGATLLLGDFPVVQKETWAALARHGATSFSGVPLTYQLLRRLRFNPRSQPTVRTYTQAGGRLDPDTKRWLHQNTAAAGARCFIMYGQTEATARISYVPPERLAEKFDSIGRPIPGGHLALDPANAEILYRGPNVMLGYAQSRADLALGDTQGGALRTGDLGSVDPEGFFYVHGRLKRFLKLAGLRVNLDELEAHLETALGGPAACTGEDESLVVHTEAAVSASQVQILLQERFGLAPSLMKIKAGVPLARLATGKIDYAALPHG